MKIRQGFVSNSSSSSFLMIVSRENHENYLKGVTPFAAAVIGQQVEERTVLGHDVYVYYYVSGENGHQVDTDSIEHLASAEEKRDGLSGLVWEILEEYEYCPSAFKHSDHF